MWHFYNLSQLTAVLLETDCIYQSQGDTRLIADWLSLIATFMAGFSGSVCLLGNLILQKKTEVR